MKVKEYLKDQREPMPKWLEEYKPNDKLDFNEVFNSRIVYYPGSEFDGQPIKTLNNAHFAHVYLYTDYGQTKENCINATNAYGAFKGYHLLNQQEINESDLLRHGYKYHAYVNVDYSPTTYDPNEIPFCLLSIFEREDEYDDEHGEKRFVLLQLYADGFATYDALFANNNMKISTIVIQDHGFGGNFNRFGEGGLLENIAFETQTYPEYMFAEKDNHWDNYELIEGLEPEFNGSHLRYLFKYIDEHLERFSYIAKPSNTEEEFIESVSNNIVQNLTDEEKATWLENSEYDHFGRGLFIRNAYLWGQEIALSFGEPDDISLIIFERVIEKLKK